MIRDVSSCYNNSKENFRVISGYRKAPCRPKLRYFLSSFTTSVHTAISAIWSSTLSVFYTQGTDLSSFTTLQCLRERQLFFNIIKMLLYPFFTYSCAKVNYNKIYYVAHDNQKKNLVQYANAHSFASD